MKRPRSAIAFTAACGVVLLVGSANAQDCVDLFNPFQVLTLDITMDPDDFEAMRFDCPAGVCGPSPHDYYPALLECGDIEPILVGIRRKNNMAEPSEADPQKVSLKIDINVLIPGQTFAGKNKLSLEHGSEGATVSEGLGWLLYQATSGFVASRAAWVEVYINGDYKGIYANVEQVDKKFLSDQGLDNGGFLFKKDDFHGEQPRTRESELNPFAFNWYPFNHSAYPPEIPTPADWLTQAPLRVDMPKLLAFAAAENFIANTDGTVQKGNNYFYYDWSTLPGDDLAGQQPRLYFPWDLDTVMKSQVVGMSVIDSGPGDMQKGLIKELDNAGVPFGYPTFQEDYFTIYKALLNGPLALSQTLALVDGLEPVISPSMDADPFQQTGPAEIEFQRLRNFLTNRTASVVNQMAALGVGYPIQVTVVGNGTVTASPDKETIYDAGEEVTLTAEPDPGWHFITWKGSVSSTDNPLQVTLTAPLSVTAFFAPLGTELVVYDFAENEGVDRFAYGTYTNSWAADLDANRQTCPQLCTLVTAVDPDAYAKLASSDATGGDTDPNRYINPQPSGQRESTLLVEFNIAEEPADVQRIDVLWEGYAASNRDMQLYIWSYAQNNWGNGAGLFGENNFIADGSGGNDFFLAGSVTSNVSDYISPTGQISLLVYCTQRATATFHDYMRVVLTIPEACTSPAIDIDPSSQTVCEGSPMTLSVAATGTPPLGYQWRKGGIDIEDATDFELTIEAAALSDTGDYDVVVTSACGLVESGVATLTVHAAGGGDVDGDGDANGGDVHSFVTLLIDGGAPGESYCAADMNADGVVDEQDVEPFIAALLGP